MQTKFICFTEEEVLKKIRAALELELPFCSVPDEKRGWWEFSILINTENKGDDAQ
jgi:hypothetical protein